MTRGRGGIVGMSVIAAAMVAVLMTLGLWQLQRRADKHALIAAMNARLAEAPVALPQPSAWRSLTPATDQFRRVGFTATYAKLPDAMVYSSGSAVRDDVSGPGTWAFLPAKLPNGRLVVVNTGFVPNAMLDRAAQDRAVAPLVTGAPVELAGYLRFPATGGLFAASPELDKRLWLDRDVAAMAGLLGWEQAGEVAPFYIDLETPVPAGGVPKPGPLSVRLTDNHMQYAITWFGLAAALMISFGFWLRGQRRPMRPVAGQPSRPVT